jgi:hypothetical protein
MTASLACNRAWEAGGALLALRLPNGAPVVLAVDYDGQGNLESQVVDIDQRFGRRVLQEPIPIDRPFGRGCPAVNTRPRTM